MLDSVQGGMANDGRTQPARGRVGVDGGIQQPQAISLGEASEISDQVQELLRAGEEHSAWERIRNLHPADIGSIVAGLPRASRDSMVRVMSPETVAWMLRQMNPVEAGRVGTRLRLPNALAGARPLRPQQALETLRRLPICGPRR